jgi:hypothetical protein
MHALSSSRGGLAPAVVVAFIFAAAWASRAVAADIDVPADQPTIQQGIDAAVDGDRVLVAPGRYVERIDYHGKNIEVIGTGGAAVTIIDGAAGGHVVVFESGETHGAVLAGFRIERGAATGSNLDGLGGGVLVAGTAAPDIHDNWIDGNLACGGGGGIAVADAARPGIHDNRIEDNDVLPCQGKGGGVYVASTDRLVVEHNRISGNSAQFGGGIAIVGGQYARSNTIVARNEIFRNEGALFGGAIFTTGDHVRIVDNLIYSNVSVTGAGIRVVANNHVAHPIIINNTLADDYGGGVEINGDATPDDRIGIIDNILVHPNGLAVRCPAGRGGSITLYDNLIYTPGSAGLAGRCKVEGTLLTDDPQFVGHGGASHAYWLQPTSPAIDSGATSFVGSIRFDLSGAPRVQGAAVDIGALEYRGE